MKTSKVLILSLFALGIAGVILCSSPAGQASGDGLNPCCATAAATKEAARHEASYDFLIAVGNALNDTETPFFEALTEAWDERREALQLANEQFRARLDICAELGHGAYDPEIEPDDFTTVVDNPYLPYPVGRILIYEKMTPEGLERVEVTVLADTIEVDEVECIIVNDVEMLDGEVVEDTVDWFAQDDDGNVWYFGEIAMNYEDGLLRDLDGSWMTGEDDAKPGILMLAAPAIGDMYRQEYFLNEAEDVARVVSLNETVVVPAGTFTNCIMTEEWNPLEPDDSLEYKYHADGVGMVLEFDVESGERLELIEIL